MKTFLKAGQWATLIAFLAISWLSVMPSQIIEVDDFNDKAKHVFAFFVLTTGLLHYWRVSWPFVIVALLGVGVGLSLMSWRLGLRKAS